MGEKKKNIVKLLSLFLALIMAVGGVLTVSAKDEGEEASEKKCTVAYLDLQNGSDENDGLTAETPLKTVEAVFLFFAEPEGAESTEIKDAEPEKATEEKIEKEPEEKETDKIEKPEESDSIKTETVTKPGRIVVLCGEGKLADEDKKEFETAAISVMTAEEYEIYLAKIEEEAHPSPVPTPTVIPDSEESDGTETDSVPTVTPTPTVTVTPTPTEEPSGESSIIQKPELDGESQEGEGFVGEPTTTPVPDDGKKNIEENQNVGTYQLKGQSGQDATPDTNKEQKIEQDTQLSASTGGENPLVMAAASENIAVVSQPALQILRKLPGKDLVGNGTHATVPGNGSSAGKTQNSGNHSLTPQRPQGSGPVYTGDLMKMYPFIISLCMSAILCGAMFRMMLENKRNRQRASYRAELERFREECKIQV